MGRIGTTMSLSDSDTGWTNTKLKRNNQVLSSSLEYNPPARTKLDKKNEKKIKKDKPKKQPEDDPWMNAEHNYE